MYYGWGYVDKWLKLGILPTVGYWLGLLFGNGNNQKLLGNKIKMVDKL